MSANCVFCAMWRGEVTLSLVHRQPEALVVMDIAPSRPGQLVIVPPEADGARDEQARTEPVARAMSLIPRCASALRGSGFTERQVHVVTVWNAAADHVHPVLTVIPGDVGLERNPLGLLVSRAQLAEDAALIAASF